MKALVILFSFLFITNTAFAAEIVIDEALVPSADPTIMPLKKDQPAGFDGVLLSPEAVARIIADKETATLQAEAEKKQAIEVCQADAQQILNKTKITLEADKGILQAERDKALKDAQQLQDALKKEVNNRPNMLFWSGVSVIVGVAATILVVKLTK
jgi:hypothetical protein